MWERILSHSALILANDIVSTYIDQSFRTEKPHSQPDSAFADPDDLSWFNEKWNLPLFELASYSIQHSGTFRPSRPH